MKRSISLLSVFSLSSLILVSLSPGCAEMPTEQDIDVERDALRSFGLISRVRIDLDVNDDGYDDLVVGSIGESLVAGVVHVYLGSSSGLPPIPSQTLLPPDGSDTVFGVVDRAGDVNGDGFVDVIVGANGADGGIGRAYLYFGGAAGLSTTPNQTLVGAHYDASSFGWSVQGAHDINADGYSDIVVGGVSKSWGSVIQAGEVYVFYGGPSGVDSSSPTVLRGTAESLTNFGYSIATAQLNGDSYTDVIVGEYRHWDWGGGPGTGRVHVFLGSPSGISTTAANILRCADGDAHGFGSSVANIGDFNLDGYGDIVVGAYGVGGNTGRAYLYAGRSDGLRETPIYTFSPPDGSGGYFGWEVRGGDVNSDGYDDVIIGETDALGMRGRVHVFHGFRWYRWFLNFGDFPIALSSYHSTLTGSHTDVGFFGQSLSIGDADGNGNNELFVGTPATSDGRGRVYVFDGSSSGVSTLHSMSIDGPDGEQAGFGLIID